MSPISCRGFDRAPVLLQSVVPMADILPFRALRYNPQCVSPSQVVTQPYDKISPEMQERYYAASPYNLVRIILGRREPQDNTDHNVYTRAAQYFRDWRSRGILQQESLPSIYAYSERFKSPGGSGFQERKSFIALGRIEDYAKNVIFRHEQTLAKPKADRLDLLRATRAHFELLFMLYEDSGEIHSLISEAATTTPTIEVTDEYGVIHRLWQISDAKLIDSLRSQMRDKKLVIADGHHRYETALNYRDECRAAASAAAPGDAPYEFVVMAFVNMNSPHLLILPTHRVVHSLNSFSPESFRDAAQAYFDVEEVSSTLDAARAAALLHERAHAGTAILAVTANRAFVLSTPRQPKPAGVQALSGLSSRQQELDVVQLHKCLLEGVLKLSEESIRNQQNLSYIRDADEALQQVRSGKANIAFLMNPCKVQQVRDIAFAGEVMPQKSTDFYPKLLSGLTIYALD
jgi:uncharacterized protein (DUF1015 family)